MTERWTDERLDKFASIVEQAIAASDARLTHLEQAQTVASSERQELREVFLTTIQVLNESSQRQDTATAAFRDAIQTTQNQVTEIQSDIREMQAEVRGLQVENRRIIDRAFGSES